MVRAVDQAYTAGMWFKAVIFNNEEAIDWCKTRGIAVTKAQGEGVDSMGGFLVPEELLANIIVLRELYGVFRRECTVVPMGSDTLNWPRRVGGLTAYWTAESTTITETEALWDNVNLTAKKLGRPVTVDPRVRQLEREKATLEATTRRLERRLQRADTIIAFQKKVAELLGISLKPLVDDETD